MEYDTERAGDLAPLGELSKGHQRVMVGFITTKSGELETMDHLKRQYEKASKFADMEQPGLLRNAALPPPRRATASLRMISSASLPLS